MILLTLAKNSRAQTSIYGKPLSLTSTELSAVGQKVTEYSAFNLHPLQLWSDINYGENEFIEFFLNVGDDTIRLNLQPGKLYSEGALMTIRGDSTPLLTDLVNDGIYRGFVDSDTNRFAGFVIQKNQLFGYYEKNGDTWFVSSIGEFTESPQSDPTSTFVKYKGLRDTSFTCGTPEPDVYENWEDSTATERVDGEYYFEMAYDVDFSLYSKYPAPVQPDDPTREELIEKDLAEITLIVESYYKAAASKLQFRIVDINVWTTSGSQPYSGGDYATHWTQGKDWWQSNKSCIQRDAVSLMSARPLGVNGYVKSSSTKIMCGSPLNLPCVAFLPYSFVFNGSGTQKAASTVAHELAHIFAQDNHPCDCSIMNGSNCSPCQSLSNSLGNETITKITQRFKPIVVCRPSGPNFPSDECLKFAPPVDLGFNLTLEADQVILTNKSLVCPGGEFTASFYNTFDPNGTIQWELGPHLQFSASQPSSMKVRNITLDPNTNCCYPFDTWVRVIFEHNCFGPVVYQRKVRANSSFGLEGIYVGPNGITNTLYTVNSATPSSSYDIRLENPEPSYTWVQTTGSVSTTLPYTTYGISFGMPSNSSTSFFITTNNECGTMNRTVAFVPPFGSYRIKNGTGATALFPNPAKNVLTFDLSRSIPQTDNKATCRIIDGTGRVLKTFEVFPREPQEVDISELPAGSYFLQVVGEQVMVTEKFQKI